MLTSLSPHSLGQLLEGLRTTGKRTKKSSNLIIVVLSARALLGSGDAAQRASLHQGH